jgi:LmbE family N-acetylglucosaminyl deacetylase
MPVLNLELGVKGRGRPRLLFIGAHCDDIEIGCGGAALELIARYPHASIDWVVLSSDKTRAAEARKAVRLLFGAASKPRVDIQEFRNSYFPTQAAEIKEFFEELKRRVTPDVVFTHFREDLHQDHRVIGELTWNTFRNHLILEYEIPKYDGGLGSPNVFVPLSRRVMEKKIAVLMKVFGTQRSKQWFTPDTFRGLMRLRGIECNAPDGYAEAFYGRKLVI